LGEQTDHLFCANTQIALFYLLEYHMFFLYKKTHCITGLQYLGQTKQSDPFKYKGSGTYWLNHLKTHGNIVTTDVLKECSSRAELEYWGQYYSNLWNVVSDSAWANLKPELGDGGSQKGRVLSANTKLKMSQSRVGVKKSIDTKIKMSISKKGVPMTAEEKLKRSTALKGKAKSEETKLKMTQAWVLRRLK